MKKSKPIFNNKHSTKDVLSITLYNDKSWTLDVFRHLSDLSFIYSLDHVLHALQWVVRSRRDPLEEGEALVSSHIVEKLVIRITAWSSIIGTNCLNLVFV